VVDPFINLLVKLRITPNVITTSALFFLAVTVYFILQRNTIGIGLMLFITGMIDVLDGAVANKVGSTRFGDFYDAFIDRLVEGIMYVAIAVAYPEYYIICFIAFLFSYMTSYVAARAEVWTIGVKIKYLGIGSRAGRLAVLIFAFMLDKIEIGLYLVVAVALITMISRSVVTLKILRKKKK
jgi:phosphatidylglycerophosphate synthase